MAHTNIPYKSLDCDLLKNNPNDNENVREQMGGISMRWALSIISICISLCACGTYGSSMPTPESLAAFQDDPNDQAMLVVGSADEIGCHAVRLVLFESKTGHYSIVRVVGSGSSKPADPAVTIVKPGHYKLLSGVCDRADYLPTDLPNLNQWFHTLEVNPGDVIYVGTLNTDIVKVQTRQKTAKAITNFLLMQDFDGRNDTEYPVYYFTEDKGKVQAYLEGHIPEIAEKLIARSPYQVLSPEAMEAAYRNAYALDEEGHMPTDEEAELKLKAEMETAVRISLDKYKADVEQRLKSIVEEREVEAQIYQGT